MTVLDFVRKTYPISSSTSCSARIIVCERLRVDQEAVCFLRLDNCKSKPIYLGANV
jgi:hypothetical protein